IARNVLSIMTRPNGYPGIPLGSPLRDAYASLRDHPSLLRTVLRAYEGRKGYLSLSLGELIATEMTPRELLRTHGIERSDRFLSGYLFTDDRLYSAFMKAYEFELQETIELLKAETKGRWYGYFTNFLGRLTGKKTREALGQSRLIRNILP